MALRDEGRTFGLFIDELQDLDAELLSALLVTQHAASPGRVALLFERAGLRAFLPGWLTHILSRADVRLLVIIVKIDFHMLLSNMQDSSFLAAESALRALSFRYAVAADDGDGDGFADTFMPDGILQVFRLTDGEEPSTTAVGHSALADIPSILADGYSRAFHIVGQGVYIIGQNEASGLVYCISNHLLLNRNGGTNHVMHLRYHDDYRRSEVSGWRISRRVARLSWTETRAINNV